MSVEFIFNLYRFAIYSAAPLLTVELSLEDGALDSDVGNMVILARPVTVCSV